MLTQRRKTLSLDNVAISPRYSDQALGNQSLGAQSSVYKGIPIVASSHDAVGTFEMATVFEEHNMGSFISTRYDISELYDYFFKDRGNIIPSFGYTEGQQHKWNELKGSLPSGKIKAIQFACNTPHNISYMYELSKFKEQNPDLIIYTSPVSDPYVAARLAEVGADVILVGNDARYISTNANTPGIGIGHVTALTECIEAVHQRDGLVMGAGYYDDNSDVCKALALGADMIQLEETLLGHEECYGKTEQQNGEMIKNDIPYKGSVNNEITSLISTLSECMVQVGVDNIQNIKNADVVLV